ncbi:MAG: DegT/DnrJ/EryC1/StrS family aminotransferase [Bryobacteraceae bacterium]
MAQHGFAPPSAKEIGPAPLFRERFRFIQPTLPPLERVVSAYAPVFRQGLITNGGLVARLEAAVCERLGVRHCVAVSSCTSGLMLVMKSLGLQGEVILPSFTFFATGHAALWNGLTPVFADCDAGTWNIDPRAVEQAITPRTSAIVAVHLYGNPAPVAELEWIAQQHGLKLLFDAAHAFGAGYKGQTVGRFGDAEVFSLSPTKLLVAGEGGLVCTNDALLAHKVRAGRNYGDLGSYDPMLLGLNARMTEFNAALALAGLDLVPAKIRRHNRIAALYTSELDGTPGISFQRVPPGHVSTYKDYSVRVDPEGFGMTRDELAVALLAENIETKKYFHPPLHQQALFRPYLAATPGALTATDEISASVLSLPVYESLPQNTVRQIAWAIRNSQHLGRGRGARAC